MNIKFEIDKLLEDSYTSDNPDFDKLTYKQKEQVHNNKDVEKHIEKSANSAVYGSLGGIAAGAALGGSTVLGSIAHKINTTKKNGLASIEPNGFNQSKFDELQNQPGILKSISDGLINHHGLAVFGPAAVGAGLGIYSAIKHGQKAKQIQNDHINSLLNKNKGNKK